MAYIFAFPPGGSLAAAGGEEEESNRGESRRSGTWLERTPLSCHTKHQEWSSGTGPGRTVLWDLRFFLFSLHLDRSENARHWFEQVSMA